MKLNSPYSGYLQESVKQEFIMRSEVMTSIMKVVNDVAKHDVNVILIGESGTGKELLAQIIHLQSPRAKHPFVPINCGVLSGLLFADKLFGHEKGSFTGAIRREKGCFELADHGTLFLDEVSEVPFENQVDFLRVLEDPRFLRIGGNEVINVNVRIISATNKNLNKLVQAGRFREDLFYRLHVVPIHIPPLRKRRGVIPNMVDNFLGQLSEKYHKPKPEVSPEVLNIFNRYEWPGNVRELKNLLERIFIVNNEDYIGVEHLPSDFIWHFETPPNALDLKQVKNEAETKAILNVLNRVGGDRKKAAQALRISPRTLRYKINKYNIRVKLKGDAVSNNNE